MYLGHDVGFGMCVTIVVTWDLLLSSEMKGGCWPGLKIKKYYKCIRVLIGGKTRLIDTYYI